MKYLSLLFFALIMSNSATAAETQGGYYELTRLYVWSNGNAHVWVDKGSRGSQKCSDQRYPNRFLLDTNAVRYDAKFSLLLTAKVTGGKVNMNYTCKNGLPYIDSIRLD